MLRLSVVVAVLGASLVAGAESRAAECVPGAEPFTIPGASLTATEYTSRDEPPVRYVMWRGTVPSFDGLPLSVDVTVPCDATGPLALVAMNHGWTDDKTIWQETGRSDTVSSEFRRGSNHHWNNIWFASKGYAVLNYTSRGWHDSCGPRTPGAVQQIAPAPECAAFDYWIHMGDMRWEVRDTQWLTGALVQSGLADPARLAITGGSYGGGQTVMNALLGDRVRCGAAPQTSGVDPCAGRADGDYAPWTTPDGTTHLRWAVAVPKYTWGDVIGVLLPNGRGSDGEDVADGDHIRPVGIPLESYLAGLYAAGQPLGNGFYAPPGVDPTADITLNTLRSLAGNPFLDADPVAANGIDQFRRFKSSILIEPVSDVPIFWVQGFTDPLFTAFEPLQIASKLGDGYPIKLYFGDFGHDYAAERVDEWDLAHEQMNDFLDHYLSPSLGLPAPTFDVGGTITRCLDPDAPMEFVSAPDWTSLHPDRVTFRSDVPGYTSHAAPARVGLLTDPVATATLPGPQSYKGCRKIAPTDDPGTASWSFDVDSEVKMIGAPVVDLTFATTSPDTQLSVRLWDVAPDGSVQGLVTRGTYRAVDGPGTDLQARFAIAPNGYKWKAGHAIKLEVTGNDAPYRQPNNLPAAIAISSVALTLPTR